MSASRSLIEDAGSESDNEGASRKGRTKFQREQEDMKEKIEKLESFNIGEKPWQLAGGGCGCATVANAYRGVCPKPPTQQSA